MGLDHRTGPDRRARGAGEVYAAAEPKLPDWTENAEEVTGRGLVSPGRVTEKTVHLEPGTYAMYCFVKSPDGQAHIAKGMSRKLVVTDADANAEPPDAPSCQERDGASFPR